MIKIKNEKVLRSFLEVKTHEKLVDILAWLDKHHPDCVVITCGHRAGDTGVHGTTPCRGADIRSWTFKVPGPRAVCKQINALWSYNYKNPNKRCAIYHKVAHGAYHIHLQVHPNTTRR